jgi:HSP20 family protein
MLPILHNRVVDNHLANVENLFDWAFPDVTHRKAQILPIDAQETETGYQYLVDVPGMTQEDLNIQVQNRTLVIQGQRQGEQTVQKDGYASRERWSGSFTRSIKLPPMADINNIQAGLRHGVLTLAVGKTEAAKPLKIEIKPEA